MATYWYNTVTKETFIQVNRNEKPRLFCLDDGVIVSSSSTFGDAGDYAESNFVQIKNIEISFDIVQPTRHTIKIKG